MSFDGFFTHAIVHELNSTSTNTTGWIRMIQIVPTAG